MHQNPIPPDDDWYDPPGAAARRDARHAEVIAIAARDRASDGIALVVPPGFAAWHVERLLGHGRAYDGPRHGAIERQLWRRLCRLEPRFKAEADRRRRRYALERSRAVGDYVPVEDARQSRRDGDPLPMGRLVIGHHGEFLWVPAGFGLEFVRHFLLGRTTHTFGYLRWIELSHAAPTLQRGRHLSSCLVEPLAGDEAADGG